MPDESDRDHASDVAFIRGAGDENRTRTISLGIRQIRGQCGSDLVIRLTARDRNSPSATVPNGPPMARGRGERLNRSNDRCHFAACQVGL
jgi:hypothetical protein